MMDKHSVSTLAESDTDDPKYTTPVEPLIFNMIFSGNLVGEDAGIPAGIHMCAGPSKSSKTAIGLHMVKSYLEYHDEGMCLFFDTEFSPKSMWASVGIDEAMQQRIMHIQIESVEELRFKMVSMIEDIDKDDKVIVFFDSLGMTASKKELEDTLKGESKQDMTRARDIKSLFRMITSMISKRRIPAVFVNHTGKEIGGFMPKEVQTGGQATELAPNTVIFFSKATIKDDKSVGSVDYGKAGHLFKLKINKSRTIKEGAILEVPWLYGQNHFHKYAGLYELALKTGDIISNGKGYRSPLLIDDQGVLTPEDELPKMRESDMYFNEDFWENTMFTQTGFLKNAEKLLRYSF